MSVAVSIEGAITRITLDRPDKLNAFDETVIADLIQALRDSADHPTRVIVIAGAGKHFCAGGDLGWMRRMADKNWHENRADARQLAALMAAVDQAPKPVIARVQGAAYGGATGLVCAADIAVAADNARLCLSEVRIGLLPAAIGPYVVRAIGARQARRYFMTAEEINAPRALALGMVHEVVPEAELDACIDRIIAALLTGAPGAQNKVRDAVARMDAPIDDDLIEYTAELIAGLRMGEEGKEGLNAFLKKRLPAWRADNHNNQGART